MTDDRSVDHFGIQKIFEPLCKGFVVILKTGAKCRGASDYNNALFSLFALPDIAASKPEVIDRKVRRFLVRLVGVTDKRM